MPEPGLQAVVPGANTLKVSVCLATKRGFLRNRRVERLPITVVLDGELGRVPARALLVRTALTSAAEREERTTTYRGRMSAGTARFLQIGQLWLLATHFRMHDFPNRCPHFRQQMRCRPLECHCAPHTHVCASSPSPSCRPRFFPCFAFRCNTFLSSSKSSSFWSPSLELNSTTGADFLDITSPARHD